MNINITHYHFEEIVKSGYTLDMIYLLKLADEDFDINTLCEDEKISVICQAIRRKGLLSENFKVTIIGRGLLNFLEEELKEPVKLVKKKITSTSFETWWKAYPGTDTFTHKGVDFSGTRTLRARRDDCLTKFNSIIAEGEHTLEDMLAALAYEVLQKKENSIKTKTNRMTFMQNSLTYLNQRTFEPFIELIKEGKKIVEAPTIIGGADI